MNPYGMGGIGMMGMGGMSMMEDTNKVDLAALRQPNSKPPTT